MVDLGNNIKVLLTKYSNNVIIDDIGGELLLYNHNNLLNINHTKLSNDYNFTVVKLEYFENVVDMVIKDFYEHPIEYIKNDGYLFIKKDTEMLINDPICVVSFLAKGNSFVRGQLYAHFIEKTI